jgi:acetyl-CoA synthetase
LEAKLASVDSDRLAYVEAKLAELEAKVPGFSMTGVVAPTKFSSDLGAKTHAVERAAYKDDYAASLKPQYWADLARKEIHWEKDFTSTLDYNFHRSKGKVFVNWFEGGKTNMCYNAVDHWAELTPDKVALIFEGNDGESETYTFAELKGLVCQTANLLKSLGVEKGDRVAMYMPMAVELPIAMLACTRIGAIHGVVFGGFSAEALASRIVDSGSKVLLTADAVMRGTKPVPLKGISDAAMAQCAAAGSPVETCVVLKRLGRQAPRASLDYSDCQYMQEGRDLDWAVEVSKQSKECPVTWMDSEDPLFILYTSGSTGTPKGVLHTTAGYMLWAATTFKRVFDYKGGADDDDVFWCTADCGWITGHSYLTYGPLLAGCTSMVFEGTPTHPDAGRFWQVCEKHNVTQLYTAPTALRSLMAAGDEHVEKYDLSSLRILGTVGEPINPEAWNWYYNKIGKGKCPIVDTWWQTETGGHMITPVPFLWPLKPGCATLPFYGVQPALMDPSCPETPTEDPDEGHLAFSHPWPGMMRSLWGNHDRFEEVYFSEYDGYYAAGDGARRDEDGYLTITGRTDDVMVISGHNIGTAEVEAAFTSNPQVAEAAVVGIPHSVKGSAIYAFIILREGAESSDLLVAELKRTVSDSLGAFARPDTIQVTTGLPKTRSGKIMRRILKKIAARDSFEEILADRSTLGDTSTLAFPEVVDELISGRDDDDEDMRRYGRIV